MSVRIPDSPPAINPVDERSIQPLWSVMIPCYNCSKFLETAIKSVLQQDAGTDKMQIEVIDDNSTDADVEAIVNTLGKGRIGFYKQSQNRGSLRNFETCINRARGKYIHLLHGDDYVENGFYAEIEKLFDQFPDAGAVSTGFWHVDENGEKLYPNEHIATQAGILHNWLFTIAKGQKFQPPAVVVKRTVYEQLGGFFGMHYSEDWEMWVRIAAHYPFAFTPLKLANYRVHDNSNITSLYFQSGQHIKDIAKSIDIIQGYLPEDKKKVLKRIAKKNWSLYFARTSDMVYHKYFNSRQAIKQARMAYELNANPTTAFFILKMYFKALIRYKQRQHKSEKSGH